MDARYTRRHGKLINKIHLPCDQKMKNLEQRAKAKDFDFNAWLRDLIDANKGEILTACGIDESALDQDRSGAA